jgi:DNA-binding XRE family transcriptional regulator
MKTHNNNLKEYRMKKKLSQFEFAVSLRLKSTDRISQWENGKLFQHILNALKLAKLYGTTVEKLFQQK